MDWARLDTDQLVTVSILARKLKSACEWVELAALRRTEDPTELAMALTEPEQTVARRKEASVVLETLPRLAEQLRRGELDFRGSTPCGNGSSTCPPRWWPRSRMRWSVWPLG
ncbi:hypothetical protein [Kutzneria kofuensis]|uniref:hypothetical protein n=1 Tax=Kutzneria kofuensis TaxID=103725 RepID=UPI0031EB5993